MLRSRVFGAALALSVAGCAAFGGDKGWSDYLPDMEVRLSSSGRSPEVDALVSKFYGDGDPAALAPAIASAIEKHPGNAALHEIAAYEAWLRGESHEAFVHFLRAAADRSAISPELYLWEMRALTHTVVEHLDAQLLLREIVAHHPRATARDVAAYYLALELSAQGRFESATAIGRSLGFIDSWLILGAFDNDQGKGFATVYPPEGAFEPERTYEGVRRPIRWRPATAQPIDGTIPLGDAISPSDSAVAYAHSFVFSPRERQVDLRISSGNDVRAWIDGKVVVSDDRISHDDLDNVAVRVTLREGWSRLLIKSAHRGGPWRLAARFTEPGGGRAADLRFAARPPGDEAAPASAAAAKPPLTISKAAALDAIADKNRKRFLLGRIWARQGHIHRSATHFEPYLTDAPKNPLAMLFTALSVWDNGEAGKALDLLNRGVAAHPKSAAFLQKRGRFYAQRKLWDKALNDVRAAVAAGPRSREASIELASVYGSRGWTIDRCHALEAAAAKWPDSAQFLGDLGQCKADRGYVQEGERLLRRASALAPGQPSFLERLTQIAERRADWDAALDYNRALRAARPAWLEPLLTEADLHRRAGKPAEAERLLGVARDASPDSPRPYDRLGQIAYEAKRVADAEKWWRLALERDPDDSGLAERIAAIAPTAPSVADKLAPTAEDIDRAVRSAPSVKAHPGSHIVVLLDDEVTAVSADGSSRRIVTRVEQAANTEGRDALIQARLPGNGRVKVLDAYSITKRGERQEASSISGGLIRFRSLDVGSIVVKQFVHYAPPGHFLPNEFTQQWRFQEVNAQVELARWRLVLAKDRPLSVQVRGAIERASEVIDGSRVFTLTARGVPPLVTEPSMVPVQDALWMGAVSTLPGWDGYVRWESALLADAFPPSKALDDLAAKLTQGAATPREKLDRLSAHVAQEIRYQQEYEDTIAGVKPHAAPLVVERGYGDCKDKSVLLIRLARALGIELRFAILRTVPYGKVLKEIPNQQFNHAIVYAPKQAGIDEAFFIDTTTNGLDVGNLRTDDQGATSLVLDPRTGAWEFVEIPYQSADLELVSHKIVVDLSRPDAASGIDSIEARGGVAAGLRVALRSGGGAQKAYQGLLEQIFPGTTLKKGKADKDQDVTRPLAIELKIDFSNAVQADGEGFRLNVPLPFALAQKATLATRQLPLVLTRGAQKLRIGVSPPPGTEVTHMPADFEVKHACFSIKRTSEKGSGVAAVNIDYRNTCAVVQPADYPAFRAAVQKVVAMAHDNFVFTAKAGARRKASR